MEKKEGGVVSPIFKNALVSNLMNSHQNIIVINSITNIFLLAIDLCDINCVQLWKVLTWFWCDNMQLKIMLSAWKNVSYIKRFCRGYNLGKVEDEEHLLFVYPNIQKVSKHSCSTLPLTQTSILVELMQPTNMVALIKFVASYQYQKTICPPWSTFHLMDFLVPNGHKIINSSQNF
jgi:hypothetical protein